MGLIFDNVDLDERFGLMIDGINTWPKPARDRELVHVPGRNGDLILDKGCWQNVDITYRFLIKDGWQDKFEEFARWLCRHRGYFRLEDPERHPDVYRMAEFADEIDPDLWFTTRTGVFSITFNCKPQQFLISGEKPIQRLFPIIMTHNMTSSYIPVASKKITYIPSIDSSATGTITGTVTAYDSTKTQVETSGAITLTDGTAVSFTITDASAAYWRLQIGCNSTANVDLVSARVIADTTIDGKTVDLDAVMARTIFYTNPTGYATKPIIKFYGNPAWYMQVKSYDEDGNWTEAFAFNISDYSSKTDVAAMDCEMQCLYYDYTVNGAARKGNLGSYLFITDAQSDAGKALSFPKFGENKILVYTYAASASEYGLAEIYPRWWRV